MAQAGGRAAPFFRGDPTAPTKGSLRCDRCASLSRQPAAATQVGSTRPSAVMMPFTHGTSQVYCCPRDAEVSFFERRRGGAIGGRPIKIQSRVSATQAAHFAIASALGLFNHRCEDMTEQPKCVSTLGGHHE
jgi:hypothetical protein